MRRVGKKGEGKFERISWDAAILETAERLQMIAQSQDGPQAVLPYSYAGTMGMVQGESMDRRFFHKLGASKLDRTICSTPGVTGLKMTLGSTVDDLDVHEGHVRAIAPLEQFTVLGVDGQDRLGDVLTVEERLDGPEPDGTTLQFRVDLLVLRVAEAA